MKKNNKLILFCILCSIICTLNFGVSKAFDLNDAPKRIQRAYRKIIKKDTSLTYLRSCGGTCTSSIREIYFLYKEGKGKYVISVYRWRKKNSRYVYKKVFHEEQIKGSLSALITFVAKHNAELAIEATNYYPYAKEERTSINSRESVIHVQNAPDDGPYVAYEIKMGAISFEGSQYWVNVDDYKKELPYLTKMIKQLHEIFSFKRKDFIIDQ